MLRSLLAIGVSAAGLVAQPLPSRPLDDAAREALVARAHVLRTADPAAVLDDLAPLAAMLGGVRVVACGESSHGSHEQQQWRHRLLRLLVERHGCDTLILECSTDRAQALDAFVHGGGGSAESVLRQLDFWPLETEEMAATLRWLRGWNDDAAHPDKVAVFGMDPQYCTPVATADTPMLRLLQAQSVAAEQMAGLDMAASWNRRDEAMAAAVASIAAMRTDGQRVFVSAHATHLRARIDGALVPSGHHLRQQFGAGLRIVSLLFDHGGFLAYDLPAGPTETRDQLDALTQESRGIVPFTVPSLGTGLAAQLAGLDRPLCVYDLRDPTEALAAFCRRASRIRIVGGGFREQWASTSEPCRPIDLADIVLFQAESTPATLLPKPVK